MSQLAKQAFYAVLFDLCSSLSGPPRQWLFSLLLTYFIVFVVTLNLVLFAAVGSITNTVFFTVFQTPLIHAFCDLIFVLIHI